MSKEGDEYLDRCHADDLIDAAWLDMQCGSDDDGPELPICARCGERASDETDVFVDGECAKCCRWRGLYIED